MQREDGIKRVHLDLTSECNLHCAFCSRPRLFKKLSVSRRHIGLPMLKARLNNVLCHTDLINLSGTFGEPTLHPELIDIIDYFQDVSPAQIRMDTNGSLHPESWWRSLASKNVAITFSVAGMTQKSHERYRRGSRLSTVLANLRAYVDCGGEAELQYIVFKQNEEEMKDAKQLCMELGIEFHPITSRRYDDKNEKPAGFRRTLDDYRRCKIAKDPELYIAFDGTVEFCCRFQPRWNKIIKHPIIKKYYFNRIESFNLYDNTLSDILRSDYFRFMFNNYQSVCGKFIKESYCLPTSPSASGF